MPFCTEARSLPCVSLHTNMEFRVSKPGHLLRFSNFVYLVRTNITLKSEVFDDANRSGQWSRKPCKATSRTRRCQSFHKVAPKSTVCSWKDTAQNGPSLSSDGTTYLLQSFLQLLVVWNPTCKQTLPQDRQRRWRDPDAHLRSHTRVWSHPRGRQIGRSNLANYQDRFSANQSLECGDLSKPSFSTCIIDCIFSCHQDPFCVYQQEDSEEEKKHSIKHDAPSLHTHNRMHHALHKKHTRSARFRHIQMLGGNDEAKNSCKDLQSRRRFSLAHCQPNRSQTRKTFHPPGSSTHTTVKLYSET